MVQSRCGNVGNGHERHHCKIVQLPVFENIRMGGLFSVADVELRDVDAGYKPEVENTIECAVNLMKTHKPRITIITGAGISSHVLPTFRSNSGSALWDVLKGPILRKSNFYDDPLPSWKLAANVRSIQLQGNLLPSPSHKIIHELLKAKYVSHVLTQNVDSLHNFPGDEDRVLELHGCVTDFGECETCCALRLVDHMQILHDQVVPKCEVCGAVLKPPVAFFQDTIPRHIRAAAYRALEDTEVLFLVGTHCAVDPVLSLVTNAKQNGVIIIEVNIETTHASGFADIVLRGTSDEVFEQIAKELLPGVNFD